MTARLQHLFATGYDLRTIAPRQNEANTDLNEIRTPRNVPCPADEINPFIGTATPFLRHMSLLLRLAARYSSTVVDNRLLRFAPRAQCQRFRTWHS
jgi:hypothetical protein